jgi:hypothetical protein
MLNGRFDDWVAFKGTRSARLRSTAPPTRAGLLMAQTCAYLAFFSFFCCSEYWLECVRELAFFTGIFVESFVLGTCNT